MRKPLTIAAVLSALAILVSAAAAGPVPTFTSAPTGFTCSFTTVSTTNDAIECSWDVLTGATKYSVDVVANYDLGVVGGSMSADFDFGTSLTTIIIPLSSFPTDINTDGATDTLTSLILRVKGLAPPGKKDSNQNNPFSSPTITCTIGTATCS